jgi:hypothetical protein
VVASVDARMIDCDVYFGDMSVGTVPIESFWSVDETLLHLSREIKLADTRGWVRVPCLCMLL